jgi:serine/threonine protein kinase
MTLVAGTRLGSYEVVALIGAGGMGEVYLARDTKLQRDVALKILPELFALDADVNAGRWQISTGGGTRPAWSQNGRELFFLVAPQANVPSRMMSVPIRSGGTFEAANPQPLFEGPYYTGFVGRTYDVSADGQRFLMIRDAAQTDQASSPPPQIVVVQNWFEELKRLVPTN